MPLPFVLQTSRKYEVERNIYLLPTFQFRRPPLFAERDDRRRYGFLILYFPLYSLPLPLHGKNFYWILFIGICLDNSYRRKNILLQKKRKHTYCYQMEVEVQRQVERNNIFSQVSQNIRRKYNVHEVQKNSNFSMENRQYKIKCLYLTVLFTK